LTSFNPFLIFIDTFLAARPGLDVALVDEDTSLKEDASPLTLAVFVWCMSDSDTRVFTTPLYIDDNPTPFFQHFNVTRQPRCPSVPGIEILGAQMQ
jgi:hypothetical protein